MSKIKAFFKKVWSKRSTWELSHLKKIFLTLALSCLTGLGLTALMVLIREQSFTFGWVYISANVGALLLTALFLMLLMMAVSFIARSVFAGGTVVTLAVLLLSLINHFKLLITSIPLRFEDFTLAAQLGDITNLNADSIVFSKHDVASVLVCVLWLAVLFYLQKPLRTSWAISGAGFGGAVCVFLVLFVFFANDIVFAPLGAGFDANISAEKPERRCGIVLSVWRSAVAPKEPIEDMTAAMLAEVKAYADETENKYDENAENPNIILILSESFFDVNSLAGVEFGDDPMATYYELCEQSVSGSFYASTVGYGTCEIELNILTGINAEYVWDIRQYDWDLEYFSTIPSVPQLLKEAGYRNTLIHTYNDSVYNRERYLSALGFDEYYFSADFAKIDKDAAEAVANGQYYYDYISKYISGIYYSDAYLAQLILDYSEQNAGDEPMFIFGMSMENHTPYTTARDGGGYAFKTDADITAEGRAVLENVAQGVHNSSEMLKTLIEYYSNSDQPTVIIFYGDHRPGMGTSTNSVYKQLGLVPTDTADATLDELMNYYATEYLIWANDESLLPAPAGTRTDSSASYLGIEILEAANVELPLYWRYLKSTRRELVYYCDKYCVTADGEIIEPFGLHDSTLMAKKQRYLKALLQDTFLGGQIATNELGSTEW